MVGNRAFSQAVLQRVHDWHTHAPNVETPWGALCKSQGLEADLRGAQDKFGDFAKTAGCVDRDEAPRPERADAVVTHADVSTGSSGRNQLLSEEVLGMANAEHLLAHGAPPQSLEAGHLLAKTLFPNQAESFTFANLAPQSGSLNKATQAFDRNLKSKLESGKAYNVSYHVTVKLTYGSHLKVPLDAVKDRLKVELDTSRGDSVEIPRRIPAAWTIRARRVGSAPQEPRQYPEYQGYAWGSITKTAPGKDPLTPPPFGALAAGPAVGEAHVHNRGKKEPILVERDLGTRGPRPHRQRELDLQTGPSTAPADSQGTVFNYPRTGADAETLKIRVAHYQTPQVTPPQPGPDPGLAVERLGHAMARTRDTCREASDVIRAREEIEVAAARERISRLRHEIMKEETRLEGFRERAKEDQGRIWKVLAMSQSALVTAPAEIDAIESDHRAKLDEILALYEGESDMGTDESAGGEALTAPGEDVEAPQESEPLEQQPRVAVQQPQAASQQDEEEEEVVGKGREKATEPPRKRARTTDDTAAQGSAPATMDIEFHGSQ